MPPPAVPADTRPLGMALRMRSPLGGPSWPQQGLQALWTLATFQRYCAATDLVCHPRSLRSSRGPALSTITPPCWTTTASAPPWHQSLASWPREKRRRARPTTASGLRHRPSPQPAGSRDFEHRRRLRQLRPADGGETQSPGIREAGAGVALPGPLPPGAPVPEYVNYQSCAQVVHHPSADIATAFPPASSPARSAGRWAVCTPTGWKCTSKGHLGTHGTGAWRGGSQRQCTARHWVAGAPARCLRPLPLPGAAVSHHALHC